MYKIPANTLFLGKNLVFVPECHSTNTLALELCQQSCPPEGTLVITNNQTAGRGQRGNTWESQPGMNLTCSLILKPTFLSIKDQFLLSMVTALAIADFLKKQASNTVIEIKWPNDIVVNEFKIAGILIENQLTGDQFTNVVVGIGLNINQTHFASPTATSLSRMTGSIHDLQEVLNSILSAFEARYLLLRQNRVKELRDDYLAQLYRFRQPAAFIAARERFVGVISGVDEQGKLCVMVDGQEKSFDTKQIAFEHYYNKV